MNLLDLVTKNEDDSYSPKLDKGQRILLVGRTGSGKSNAEISFPGPAYVFDFDNRIKGTVSALKWLGLEKFKTIDFDYYNPSDGFGVMDDKLSSFLEQAQTRKLKYKTLCFDSVGSIIYTLALESQRLRGANKDFTGKVRGKVKFLHPDDYNYVATAIRLIVFERFMPLNELGINILVSAWITDKWGKGKNSKEYDAAEIIGEKIVGPGNTVEEFNGYFDEAYYFRKEASLLHDAPRYTVEFNGTFAKTALNLPPGIFDVTGKSFYDFWVEKVGRSIYSERKEK
jgi:hypothetical protein